MLNKPLTLEDAKQADIIRQIRESGVWFQRQGVDDKAHYYVCNHPTSSLGISLCYIHILPLGDITITEGGTHCATCESYLKLRKERLASKPLSKFTPVNLLSISKRQIQKGK